LSTPTQMNVTRSGGFSEGLRSCSLLDQTQDLVTFIWVGVESTANRADQVGELLRLELESEPSDLGPGWESTDDRQDPADQHPNTEDSQEKVRPRAGEAEQNRGNRSREQQSPSAERHSS